MPKANEKLRKIVLLLITWGVLLGFFIGYENYFVAGQQEYLIDQEFRNLSRLSAQLSAQFERARLSVSSLAKIMHATQDKTPSDAAELDCRNRELVTKCFAAYSKDYLPEIWNGGVPSKDQLLCLGKNPENVHLRAEREVSGLKIAVFCPEDPLGNVPVLRLDMSPWVQAAFEEYKNSFDDLLVADQTGQVLLQQSVNGPRIADLRPLLASGTDISVKPSAFGFLNPGQSASTSTPPSKKSGDADASAETGKSGKGKNVTPKPAKLERLSHGSSATRVSIGGHTYFLFAQPSQIALGGTSGEGSTWPLVLVGLRLASSVEAESHALPYSVLIWVALCAVVLLGFSWPWFKLQYMSNTERFRPGDGWVLLFTLLLVSAGVMLMLLNGSYLLRSRDATDMALQAIARQMKANFAVETSHAFRQLQEVRGTPEFERASKDPKDPGLEGNFPIEKYRAQPYPYFEIAFWADCEGAQLAKVDIRKVATPAINLDRFPFFQVVKTQIDWDEHSVAPGKQTCPPASEKQDSVAFSFFQPVLSPNTNEFAPVLSAPFSVAQEPAIPSGARASREFAIQALVFRPMSVIDPVLPPGYGFAIIDDGCNILFDSDSFRNMRENFCEESKDKSELRPWLLSGVDTPLGITYGGRGKRAFLTNFPFPGLSARQPVYLLVFQEGDQQLTLDLAIIVVASICLLFYFLVIGLAAAAHLILRGHYRWNYAPRIIWPCKQFAGEYLQIFLGSVILCALYRDLYRDLHEAPLIGLTLGLALIATLFAILRLYAPPAALLRSGIVATFFALLLGFGVALFRWHLGNQLSASASAGLTEWTKLLCLPFVAGIVATLAGLPFPSSLPWLNLTPELMEEGKQWMARNFNLLYALALAGLMVCTSVVPCAGFFKYAYDEVSELSLKHDEAVLAERLVQRRDRIAQFYSPFHAHQIARDRLALPLDRYDKSAVDRHSTADGYFFETCNEPDFDDKPNYYGCPVETKEDPVDLGLNDWIEKHIAQATLTFPSNDLGSAMSRLGVAETDEATSWERYWQEPEATTFILSWKPHSRAPGFMIWGGYPEEHVLLPWARFCLFLFIGIMLVWLTNLTRMIFLTQVECATSLEVVRWKNVKQIKRDTLLIGLPRSGKSAQLRKLEGLDPRDFRDFRDLQSGQSTASRICGIESTDCWSGVIILDQFDFNMRDPEWNQKRLELIERLMKDTEQKLVLVSTVDPMYFLTAERDTVLCAGKDAARSSHLLERWARALDKFARVKLPNTVEDEFAEAADRFFQLGGPYAQFANWICLECSYTPMLQRVGVELLEKYQKPPLPTRQQVTDMLVDRVDAYYRMLWAGLSGSERLVLYQLALDGWANPKNAAAIHQLEQKHLIYRQPMYRIMNDSFRDFIRSSEHQLEIQDWQKKEQQSTWQALRFVLLAAVIGVVVWLLYAQAQLFQIGLGYITAIGTLLTAVAGFTARWKRSPAAPVATDSSAGS